ncbi:hypothetical protein ACFQX4_24390 [Roseomonas sp. GCM10028921]
MKDRGGAAVPDTGLVPKRFNGTMFKACFILTRMNADLLVLATESMMLAVGAVWFPQAPARPNRNLAVLGFDQMPSSRAELRGAYRHAARAAHPDAGGSADASRTVSEAFGRLTSERLV